MHRERLEKLQKKTREESCDAFLVEDSINLYYLTGLELSEGKLLLHHQGIDLLVDGRYYEVCRKKAPCSVVLFEGEESLDAVLKKKKVQTLGFNQQLTSYARFLTLSKKEGVTLQPLEDLTAGLRSRKDPNEIALLRDAAYLGSEGFDFVCSQLKEGVTEKEVAAELEIFWKRKGGKALAFDPIIAFGANSSMPHYRVSDTALKIGDPVLIDIGVNLEHYHSDMTRVVYYGQPKGEMLKIHGVVQEAQKRALNLCRPGEKVGNLDRTARDYIEEQGYGHYFTHSLGHGVGLEIHEAPGLRKKPPHSEVTLEEGMVITIEPGIYLPDVGGVRIEDSVVITHSGYENFTQREKDPVFITV